MPAALDKADLTRRRPLSLKDNTWKSILDGPLRRQAIETVQTIARTVQEKATWANNRAGAEIAKIDASLAGGSAGLAIFYAYLGRSIDGDAEPGREYLDHAMDAVSTTPMGPSLYGGFTGIAWSIAHLREWFLERDGDATESIDELLCDHLSHKPWRGDYDLISGLVGFGVYALERLPSPLAIESLEHVVDRLEEIAQHAPNGITWFSPPELIPDWQRELCPGGYYNVGMAHGVPGVIVFLGQVCALDSEGFTDTPASVRLKARRLLDGAVAWLLAQKCEAAASIFPNWIGPGITPEPSRVAWCYGDLGIAVALMVAARCVNEARWERQALELARLVAERPPEQSEIRDCGLCHGAAGVAHLFNRLFQATGEFSLRDAAQYWFQRTLKMRRPGQGVAGFVAFRLNPDGTENWVAEVGILEGAAGVALALLAAATDVEPAWDSMMLASIPNRART